MGHTYRVVFIFLYRCDKRTDKKLRVAKKFLAIICSSSKLSQPLAWKRNQTATISSVVPVTIDFKKIK